MIGRPGQVDDSGVSEVVQEKVDAANHSFRLCVAVVLTLALMQMALELYQRLLVQLTLWRALLIVPVYEVDEVFCSSEMVASRNGGVAGFR
jgi:hypothetical protein